MAEHEDTLARVIETLKEPVRIDPSLGSRVMSEIEQLSAHGASESQSQSPLAWLWRRRTVRVSPLGGLAMAAGLAALVFAGSRWLGPDVQPSTPPARSITAESPPLIQFVLVAPEAGSVAVVGDFNDWSLSATPLVQQKGDGVWWVSIPLPPGRYRYSFVVDGTTWRSDPNAPTVRDEFGRRNSVVTVGGA